MAPIRFAALYVLVATLMVLPVTGAGKEKAQFSLSEKPSGPRFPLPKERIWPGSPGQADVCLWNGDRFAALSITIDDNTAPDHAWWEAITQELGLKVTWFVITDRIGSAYGGGWPDFQRLHAAGYGVGSHTATHLGNVEPPWKGIEWEYAESKSVLESSIPGLKVLTLAYSGGKNSELHDRTLAAKYYIAARGTVGTPNPANQIDYMNTSSAGNGTKREYIDSVLEGTSSVAWLGGGKYLRSWLCTHFHGIGSMKTDVETQLRYIKEREADLWVGLFDDVVRYGQERDTHKLAVVENSSAGVKFDLTDDMRDDIYNVPLTVKLKLYPDWKGARAEQNGRAVACTVKEHAGALFVLVQAVPDGGTVTVLPVP